MFPLVSVIVPVYNVSLYLRQCMDSIVNQTLKDIEIICVDDGSTDDSLAILQEYAKHDSRITILQQENKGGGTARNLGMTKATGKYLIFLDSDDFFKEDMLMLALEKGIKTDADMVIFEWKIYDNKKNIHSKIISGVNYRYLPKKDPFSKDELKENMFNFTNLAPWNKLYKRDYIMKNKINFQNLKNCNDVSFSLKAIYFANRITIVSKALLSYRINIGMSTQDNSYKDPMDVYIAFNEVKNVLSETPQWNIVKKSLNNIKKSNFSFHLNKLKLQHPNQYYELLHIISEDTDNHIKSNNDSKYYSKIISKFYRWIIFFVKLSKHCGYACGIKRSLFYIYEMIPEFESLIR